MNRETLAPSAMETEENQARSIKRSTSANKSSVKFGKVNQVIDYNSKSGKKITSYLQPDSGDESNKERNRPVRLSA